MVNVATTKVYTNNEEAVKEITASMKIVEDSADAADIGTGLDKIASYLTGDISSSASDNIVSAEAILEKAKAGLGETKAKELRTSFTKAFVKSEASKIPEDGSVITSTNSAGEIVMGATLKADSSEIADTT